MTSRLVKNSRCMEFKYVLYAGPAEEPAVVADSGFCHSV